MSEVDTAVQERSRGQLAQQVVESQIYQEAFLSIKAQILSDIQRTKFKETDVRDECWRKLQTLERMESYFASVMTTGKVASDRLSRIQKLKKTVVKTVMG